jgi:hypothetical protein
MIVRCSSSPSYEEQAMIESCELDNPTNWVSRSRSYRLRKDQAWVGFLFGGDVMNVQEGLSVVLKSADVALSPHGEDVLARLLEHPID